MSVSDFNQENFGRNSIEAKEDEKKEHLPKQIRNFHKRKKEIESENPKCSKIQAPILLVRPTQWFELPEIVTLVMVASIFRNPSECSDSTDISSLLSSCSLSLSLAELFPISQNSTFIFGMQKVEKLLLRIVDAIS